MLKYALTFFLLALIFALFGFGNLVPGYEKAFQFSFFLMVILFILTLVFGPMPPSKPAR